MRLCGDCPKPCHSEEAEADVGIRSLLAARRRRAPLGRKELRIVPEGNALGVPRQESELARNDTKTDG